MITSLRNEKVRLVRALQTRRKVRLREGCFVIEGIRLGEEAVRAGAVPRFVLYTAAAHMDERAAALIATWTEAEIPCYEVSEEVMEACSATETPPGLLAVVPIPSNPSPAEPTFVLVVDRVRDPGNLGTILRTALAAGVDWVTLAPGTVDPTNPKVVRAGAGAHFWLPVARMGWEAIGRAVTGCRVYLAAARGERPYTEIDWSGRIALVVGGEAAGAGERARALAETTVFIPMAPGVESLNVAVATGVLLFEAMRQRGIYAGKTAASHETDVRSR